jgi:hypothetical protein
MSEWTGPAYLTAKAWGDKDGNQACSQIFNPGQITNPSLSYGAVMGCDSYY